MSFNWNRSARLSRRPAKLHAAIAPMAVAIMALGTLSEARAGNRLTTFDRDPLVSKAELAKLRGGFKFGGAVVNFGLEIQQFVNNATKPVNDVQINLVQNKFTVTQTTGGTTKTTELTSLPQTFAPTGPINNGATQLAVTLTNQAVQSVIQNSASNQALTSTTTLNVSTEGLVNQLRQAMATNQMIRTLQANGGWTHH